MGVDSGLPDFRGTEGFWKAYPPIAKLGKSFVEMANPRWFHQSPKLAWAFYGHRLNLYRETSPHAGFGQLLRIAERKQGGYFVFTSNVDGQFQVAGFDDSSIVECHGSIHHLQCTAPCCDAIWDAAEVEVEVDEASFRARGQLPTCPSCGRLARPNVLMFGDWSWLSHRTHDQERRMAKWLGGIVGTRLVIVEVGAGTAVPTVRMTAERTASRHGGALIRINLREPWVPPGQLGFGSGALEALSAIDSALKFGR